MHFTPFNTRCWSCTFINHWSKPNRFLKSTRKLSHGKIASDFLWRHQQGVNLTWKLRKVSNTKNFLEECHKFKKRAILITHRGITSLKFSSHLEQVCRSQGMKNTKQITEWHFFQISLKIIHWKSATSPNIVQWW